MSLLTRSRECARIEAQQQALKKNRDEMVRRQALEDLRRLRANILYDLEEFIGEAHHYGVFDLLPYETTDDNLDIRTAKMVCVTPDNTELKVLWARFSVQESVNDIPHTHRPMGMSANPLVVIRVYGPDDQPYDWEDDSDARRTGGGKGSTRILLQANDTSAFDTGLAKDLSKWLMVTPSDASCSLEVG